MIQPPPAHPPAPRAPVSATSLFVAQLAAAIMLTAWGPALRYDRAAVSAGEWWRLLTAGYSHVGAVHLALNFAALSLILLVQGDRTARQTLVCLPMLSVSVYLTEHWALDHSWAAGLSGAVHGAAVLCVLGPRPGAVAWVLPVAVSCKSLYELWEGPSAMTSAMIGAPVLSQHHLAGTASGWAFAAAIWGCERVLHPPHRRLVGPGR